MKGKEFKLCCCEKCQVYWTCDTKWYRGERQEENICCPRCNFHNECLAKPAKKAKPS